MSSKCPLCERDFGDANHRLQKHVNSVHVKGGDWIIKPFYKSDRFFCEICDNTFANKTNLKSHIETVHQGKRNYSCHLCEKKYSTGSNLNAHVKIVHEGRREHQCEFC